VLKSKWVQQIGDPAPSLAADSQRFLEHWYNAVWHYQGTLSHPAGQLYPDDFVFPLIEGKSRRCPALPRWSYLTPTGAGDRLGQYAVRQTGGKYNVSELTQPTFSTANQYAHADLNLDGVIDVTLAHPLLTAAGAAYSLSIEATAAPEVSLTAVMAELVHQNGSREQAVSLTRPVSGTVYETQLPGSLATGDFISFTIQATIGGNSYRAAGATYPAP
jgi:hypothetical protein